MPQETRVCAYSLGGEDVFLMKDGVPTKMTLFAHAERMEGRGWRQASHEQSHDQSIYTVVWVR